MSFRAPLRITGVRLRPPAPLSDQVLATPSAEQAPASVETPEADSYIERLIKLIPVEVVGAYLVGRELAEIHQMEATWGFVCLVFVVVFRVLMTQPEGLTHFSFAQVQTGVVLISLISFIIWVYSLGGEILFLPPCYASVSGCEADWSWMASLALLLWTPLVPYLYRGAPAPEPVTEMNKSRAQIDGNLSPIATSPLQHVTSAGPSVRDDAAASDLLRIAAVPAMPSDIIGADERERVADPKAPPYAAIGLIHAFRGNERRARSIGTGWLAWNHRIVTAAHVVYSPFEFGGRAARVHVWLGYDRRRNDNPAIVTGDIRVHPQYVATGDRRYDIAVIDFDTALPAGPPFSVPNGTIVRQGTDVEVAGYPSDLGGFDMVAASGQVVEVEPQRLFYDTDTKGGQSGAPVLMASSHGVNVVGIHVDGTEYSGELGSPANLGVRLTDELVGWIDETA